MGTISTLVRQLRQLKTFTFFLPILFYCETGELFFDMNSGIEVVETSTEASPHFSNQGKTSADLSENELSLSALQESLDSESVMDIQPQRSSSAKRPSKPKQKKKNSSSHQPLNPDQIAKSCFRATNYYLPDLDTESRYRSCARTDKVKVGKVGKTKILVCPQFVSAVKLQGSGLLSFKGKKFRLTYTGGFEAVKKTHCSTAIGAANTCLIPYVHIAADPRYFNMGDVIEVPELRHTKIPRADGKGEFLHPGYFIVADTGGDIKGKNRFDFFVGKKDPLTRQNPLGPWGKKMTDQSLCIMSFKRINKRHHPEKAARMARTVIAAATGVRTPLIAARSAKP